MRLIDADKLRQRLNPDDWGTPDERWRPEREFGELIDYAPTVDRWHYPSKGEYPTDDGKYLVVLKSKITGNTHTTLQDYYTREGVFGDHDKIYFEISDVVAWMPLPDPPKEEA